MRTGPCSAPRAQRTGDRLAALLVDAGDTVAAAREVRSPPGPVFTGGARLHYAARAMDDALLHRLRSACGPLFAGQRLLAAYAYGSRVAGRPLPGSDLDVGYYLLGHRHGETLAPRDELRLASLLSDTVGVEVDLRNLAEAPLELRGRVLEEGIRIFSGDDVERVGLERDLLSRYHDYKEEFRRMHEIRLRRTAEKGL